MFTVLLCSLIVNAVQSSLPQVFNNSERSLVSEILAHKNNVKNDQVLIDLVEKLDPTEVSHVITLVEGLKTTSQEDLDRITTDSVNADAQYTRSLNDYNVAVAAQIEGNRVQGQALEDGITASLDVLSANISAIQGVHDTSVANLQADFNTTRAVLEAAANTHYEAEGIFYHEYDRLVSENASLTAIIDILKGISPASGNCRWSEEPTSTCNHNRNMLCNNQIKPECTLDYCKNQAMTLSYKYFTYGTGHWCIMCDADANGLMIDAGDVNTAYTLYTQDCSYTPSPTPFPSPSPTPSPTPNPSPSPTPGSTYGPTPNPTPSPRSSYYQLPKSTCCCPIQDRIRSKAECIAALTILNFEVGNLWLSGPEGYDKVPGQCSWRLRGHWNSLVDSGVAGTNIIPICRTTGIVPWECYYDRYADFITKDMARTEEAATNHWKTQGRKEGRTWGCEMVPWECYYDRYADFITYGMPRTEEAATNHWKTQGRKEGRTWGCEFTYSSGKYCADNTPHDFIVGLSNVEDCRAKCSADPSCQAFDYAHALPDKWCVIVPDSRTCTLTNNTYSKNWDHYQKN